MDEGAGPNYRPDTTRRGCDGGRQRNADERSSQQYSIYRCVPLTIEMCHRSDVFIHGATMDRRRLAFRSVRPTPSACTLHFDHSRLLRSGSASRDRSHYSRSGSASRDRSHYSRSRECITRPEPTAPRAGVITRSGAHYSGSGSASRDESSATPGAGVNHEMKASLLPARE